MKLTNRSVLNGKEEERVENTESFREGGERVSDLEDSIMPGLGMGPEGNWRRGRIPSAPQAKPQPHGPQSNHDDPTQGPLCLLFFHLEHSSPFLIIQVSAQISPQRDFPWPLSLKSHPPHVP